MIKIMIASMFALVLAPGDLPTEMETKAAVIKLETTPDDAGANLILGKWHAFVKGNWETALPYLSKGSDALLKAVASKDCEATKSPDEMVVLGDEWVKAGAKLEKYKRFLEERASCWYQKAWLLLDAAKKEKLRPRALKLLLGPVQGQAKKGTPAGWTQEGTPSIFIDSSVCHGGNKSVRIDGDNQKNPWGRSCIKSLVVGRPGKYVFSAWIATDGTEDLKDQLVLDYLGVNGNWAGSAGPFIETDLPFWKKYEIQVDVPETVSRIQISVNVLSKKGKLWVDDLSLKWDGKEVIENLGFEK